MQEDNPKVLVGGPVTEYKIYCSAQFLAGIKKMTYENKVVVLIDNSPTNALRESISRFNVTCPFYVITTKNRAYARQRLVEGRNLLKDIMLKKKDLSFYELSAGDEKKVRELQEMDFEYFFSLEQDVIPPVDVIEKLLADQKNVVEGGYFNSKKLPNGTVGMIPMAWNWADPEVKEAELLIDIPMDFLVPSRVIPIAAIGLGCCLMKKEVLEKMECTYSIAHKFPEGATQEDIKRILSAEEETLKICAPAAVIQMSTDKVVINGFRYDKSKYACDDMYFSLDASKVGYELCINSYVWCRHLHQQWDIQQVGER